ncbi:MAG TPA: hypothetical protein VEY07_05035 [Thermoplasmata archaeon]|nr:hypothetical protein [Thermoplasmata archaeon]
MAPTCTNCGGTDFVWANELKTGGGMSGGGTLSLRPRGEIPLGTRICRACGHAELFLRDLTLLHQPHTWRAGEFIPIVPKSKPATPEHHGHSAPPPPPPPPPEPTPVEAMPVESPPSPPAAPPAPEPEPSPVAVEEPVPTPVTPVEETTTKPKSGGRRKSTRSKP